MAHRNRYDSIMALLGKGLDAGAHAYTKANTEDPLSVLLKAQTIQDRNDARTEKDVNHLETSITRAGTPQMVQAMQRTEDAIPGVFTKPGEQPTYKSVGGMKNLVPNFAVPLAEKAHEFTGGMVGMEPGAAKERSALQDYVNTKIYDSSGKTINENEAKRLNDAMGLGGVFGPEQVSDALRQQGYQTLEKQRNATAGVRPEAVRRFKERGGMAGAKTMAELLGKGTQQQPENMLAKNPPKTPPSGLAPADTALASQPPSKQVVKTLRNKKTGQTKVVYDDGSEEIQ